MFSILWMLFVAWFLQLFEFNSLVINGMAQLFGVEMVWQVITLCWVCLKYLHTLSVSGRMVKLSGDLEDLSEKLK